MVKINYVGSSCDCPMTDEEYTIYEAFMKDTFYCILCEMPHNRIHSKLHSMCQIDDSKDYPEDWRDV